MRIASNPTANSHGHLDLDTGTPTESVHLSVHGTPFEITLRDDGITLAVWEPDADEADAYVSLTWDELATVVRTHPKVVSNTIYQVTIESPTACAIVRYGTLAEARAALDWATDHGFTATYTTHTTTEEHYG